MQLLFLDLETTGLEPHINVILEVAACVVETCGVSKITVWNEFDSVVFARGRDLEELSKPVFDMHSKSGLLSECQHPDVPFLDEVETALCSHIKAFADCTKENPLYLAGSSIHFDRAFIKVHMPELDQLLHYRMLDVSSFRLLEEFVGLPVFEPEGEKRHRAVSDMRGSIEMFQHYREVFDGKVEHGSESCDLAAMLENVFGREALRKFEALAPVLENVIRRKYGGL